jgi:hypothetical protein
MKTYQFTAAQFTTVHEKQSILKQWVTFLKYGCKLEHFTKTLYNHLIQHCCFIAHYSLHGFYETYFARGDSRKKFLSQFDKRGECVSVEYGYVGNTSGNKPPWGTAEYQDINRAMIEEAAPFIPALIEGAKDEQRTADILTATALLRKYSITEWKFENEEVRVR